MEGAPILETLESRLLLSSGPIPIDDFAGLPHHSSPPDPICAAGPDSLLAMVNYRLGLYQKDGTPIEDTTFAEFYDAVDHGGQIFDPWVVYDQYSNRYVAMAAERELGDTADEAWFLIGISTSSSPDDFDVAPGDSDNDWWVYSVNASRNFGNGPTWADYPKLAADADSIYITSNNLTFAHGTVPAYWGGILITRLNKVPMLGGTAVAPVQIDGQAAGLRKTTQAVQSVGRSASQPQLFVDPAPGTGGSYGGIRVWELDDSNNLTVSPTLGSQFQAAGSHSPQGDTYAQIIVGGSQLMNAVWRDDSLWTAHAVSNVVDPIRTFDSGTVNLSIPDLGTRTSTLSVSGLDGLVMDVNVTVNITHTYDGDLDVYLISPSGTRTELFTDVGDGGGNFTGTELDDSARDADGNPRPITGGSAPFTGTFRPEGFLSELE
ncbi:MAG: proprotein convertase P-domain-containing protein, partial [Phycisphaerae bacterium]